MYCVCELCVCVEMWVKRRSREQSTSSGNCNTESYVGPTERERERERERESLQNGLCDRVISALFKTLIQKVSLGQLGSVYVAAKPLTSASQAASPTARHLRKVVNATEIRHVLFKSSSSLTISSLYLAINGETRHCLPPASYMVS